MNKSILCLALASSSAISLIAAPPAQLSSRFDGAKKALYTQALRKSNTWRNGAELNTPAKAMSLAPRTNPDGTLPRTSSWGTLYTPEGEEWMYTVGYEQSSIWVEDPSLADGGYYYYTVDKANFVIYNADMKQVGQFSVEIEPANGETSINFVQIAPTLSRKFFNVNDAYEVMVFIHATTDDYAGHCYTKIYTLTPKGSEFICDIEGNQVEAINMPKDTWDETFTMVFMREELEFNPETFESKYYLIYDVYGEASYGTTAQLLHSFQIDYEYFAGAGDYAMPLLMNKHRGQLYYALPHYEKPFFMESENYWADPDPTPDNNFLIDLYDSNFELIKTTSIPMTTKPGTLWTFPGMGELMANDDLYFPDDYDEPCYIVGLESYITSSDDFTTDLLLYDADGNLLKTLVEDVSDYISLSDIKGLETQYCFYIENDEESVFRMIDIPSGTVVGDIPTLFDPDNQTYISTSINRIPVDGAYNYVSSLNTADVDAQGNVLHRLAWFNSDCSFDHYQYINLGQDIVMAQVYMGQEAFNPYLFNTDSQREFMVLVKALENPNSSRATEELRIYNETGQVLLSQGPDEATDSRLNSIFLTNPDSPKAKLIVSYSTGDDYSINYFDLPITKFSGGEGTAENPYLLSTPGDPMYMSIAPSACYVMANDIDFQGMNWDGITGEFSGQLDGQGHTISNLNLTGHGIFHNLVGDGSVRNLNIANSTLTIGGFVAGMATGASASSHPVIENVHTYNCTAQGSGYMSIGGIVGTLSVYSEVTGCSVSNADFTSDGDVVIGGLIGDMMSGSKVSASLFTGTISAAVAGGIAGSSSNAETAIANCHVCADITAQAYAGGIIGESGRTRISNCYAQGTISAIDAHEACAAGIAGYLGAYYDGTSPKGNVVEGCIVNAEISANADAAVSIAHRIVGSTSVDRGEIDWDNVTEGMDISQYPRLPGVIEIYLGANYAAAPAHAIDKSIAEAKGTTEGISIAADALCATAQEAGWAFGAENAAPWVEEGNAVALYYESTLSDPMGIHSAFADNGKTAIVLVNGRLCADGAITLYAISGVKVATADSCLDTRSLPRGIYIATCNGKALKIRL